MRLYASDGIRGKIIDLDTGRPVPKVVWVDEQKGFLEAYRLDSQGNLIKKDGEYETYLARGRFRFIPNDPKEIPLSASRCAKCQSKLVLVGDELCPKCKAADRGKPYKRVEPGNIFAPSKCELCSRQAVWQVGDEVDVAPQKGEKKFGISYYARAMSVGTHYYCEWHFQPPRLLDASGEPIKNFVDNLNSYKSFKDD